MDILKVLSRGTKGHSGLSRGNAFRAAADLPSAGAHIHPQLFHDAVGSATDGNSRKRKRGGSSKTKKGDESGDGEEPSDEDDGNVSDASDLDFFATRDSAKTAEAASAKKAKPNGDSKSGKKTKEKTAKNTNRSAELLDEEECRQILRSHRLKLTLLSDKKSGKAEKAEKEKEKKKKSSKKSKKEAEEEAKSAKDDKKPVLPQPLTAFSQLRHTYGISPRLADNLDRLLYRIPTEVQMGSLPLLLDPSLALSKTELPGDGSKGLQEGLSGEGGVDFMAVAPTGSGKTLSFLVPSINSVLKRRADDKAEVDDAEAATSAGSKRRNDYGLHTVVVAPTRELARQIANEGKKLAVGTGVRVVAMRKGMRVQAALADGADGEEEGSEGSSAESDEDDKDDDEEDEEDEQDEEGEEEQEGQDGAGGKGSKGSKGSKGKKAGAAATVTRADILVTTPLMLLNFLTEGTARRKRTLPTVRTLVLDEADVLLDPLFREQTLGLWAACTHGQLQATFWSATMASNVEELVGRELAEKKKSRTGGGRLLVRLVVGLKDTAVPNVTHRLVYTATEQGKLLAMRQLLHPTTSVSVTGQGQGQGQEAAETPLRPPFLVFAQTAERATALHDELKYDIPAAAGGADRLGVLHAALSDGARAAVVRRFRAGEVWVLITTDVLARGIDFAGVNGVVNYDVPGSAAAYVHRAGRTGRAGRQGGLAVTLYTKEDIPFVKSVANVIAASEKQAGKGRGRGAGSGGGDGPATAAAAVPQWLLDALPTVTKADKKRLKTRGMESRRTGGGGGSSKNGDSKNSSGAGRARITSKSAWERRKENNRRDAIASSKRRKREAETKGADDEWVGLD